MENSDNDTEQEKNPGGRPRIPGLTPKLCHLDADDLEWAKERYKGKVRPDGTKDSVDALLRRLLRAHREHEENEEIIAWARAQKGNQ